MVRLCERPGCSEPGAAAYGMIPEDLLFWIAPLNDAPVDDHNVLCRRHADAMVVPRGWTLDDRREPIPRLFMPRRPAPAVEPGPPPPAPRRRRPRPAAAEVGEQLQIDGTGEIARPVAPDAAPAEPAPADPAPTDPALADPPSGAVDTHPAATVEPDAADQDPDPPYAPWQPDFDHDDDLGGLLKVRSPLLARAFRGTGRARS